MALGRFVSTLSSPLSPGATSIPLVRRLDLQKMDDAEFDYPAILDDVLHLKHHVVFSFEAGQ